MNHCVLSRGSMTSSCAGSADDHLVWCSRRQVAPCVELGHDPGARHVAVEARRSGVPVPVIGASSARIVGAASRGAGRRVVVVIVGRGDLHGARPEARSTTSSAMIGTSRSTNGIRTRRPTTPHSAGRRVDRDCGVAKDRLGSRRGDGDRRVRVGPPVAGSMQVVANRPERARLGRRRSTSRSLTLVRQPGHQLTRASVRYARPSRYSRLNATRTASPSLVHREGSRLQSNDAHPPLLPEHHLAGRLHEGAHPLEVAFAAERSAGSRPPRR